MQHNNLCLLKISRINGKFGCMCGVCMWYTCVYKFSYACVSEVNIVCLSQSLSSLCFEIKPLVEPGAHQFSWSGWWKSTSVLLSLCTPATSPRAAVIDTQCHLGFLCRFCTSRFLCRFCKQFTQWTIFLDSKCVFK